MNDIVLETTDLTKTYRDHMVIDHMNMKIEKGKIYGFIGRNGAGKTTFLRLVTGLAFPTSGRISLWGQSMPAVLQAQRKRIGCLIETPALYPTMSAQQNLEMARISRGIPDRAVIERTLALVGLAEAGKKRVRHFSLGMRQRLGIAMALLHTPEFLILDEPINGLDPEGIADIRALLLQLNREYGTTILVSSHILEELHQLASDFIIIEQGRIIEKISAQTLDERCKQHLAIATTDPQKALLALEGQLQTSEFTLMPDGTIRLYDHLDDVETVATALADAHVLVTGLTLTGASLEDYFLQKIGGDAHGQSPQG
ncbi:MAG: ATP-binding cassette domain-containing protein [Peptococcaceae bacterium]|nr:ATP-binding cassette domain-containing protein [Peptococcaceae bacterium]